MQEVNWHICHLQKGVQLSNVIRRWLVSHALSDDAQGHTGSSQGVLTDINKFYQLLLVMVSFFWDTGNVSPRNL